MNRFERIKEMSFPEMLEFLKEFESGAVEDKFCLYICSNRGKEDCNPCVYVNRGSEWIEGYLLSDINEGEEL